MGEIKRYDGFTGVDTGSLGWLLENSFNRTLTPEFFKREPVYVIISDDYRGGAVLYEHQQMLYLGKIAVHPDNQGNGLACLVMQEALDLHKPLFWRARPNNHEALSWYLKLVDEQGGYHHFNGTWHIFGIHMENYGQFASANRIANQLPSSFIGEYR